MRRFALSVSLVLLTIAGYTQANTQVNISWSEEPQYTGQKAEWKVDLPDDIEEAIANWVENQHSGSNKQPALNPFDPDQIDVRGLMRGPELPAEGEPVFGFYYEGYERKTENEDKNLWDWAEIASERGFRIRWSALATGVYTLMIWVDVPGRDRVTCLPYSFEIKEYSWSDQFIGISPNGHYLKFRDYQHSMPSAFSSAFFPVGKNIWEGAYDCNCDIPCAPFHLLPKDAKYECTTCYQEGDDDICCGLSVINRMSRCKPWSPGKSVREMCLPAASYVKLENVINQIARSGANTIRFPIYPSSFEIEFEKINNYLDRQYQAWELDQLIANCERLDLHIQLNMGMQSPYQNHPYGAVNWDWFDTNICDEAGKSQSWCYRKDLNLEKPYDFFESQEARHFYKKKLRYFIARWGYSSQILLLELFSEMNGAGSGTVYNHPPKGCDWWNKPRHLPMPYEEDMKHRAILASWNREMLRYVKEDLGHTRHLVTVDYTGKAPMTPYADSPDDPCQSPNFDSTWIDPACDVICWNNYGASANRFRLISVDEYGVEGRTPGYQCAEGMSATSEEITGYDQVPKPVLYGENGFGDDIMACDYTGFVRDLCAITFSGHANSGMSWDEIDDTSHWHWMGYVRRFMDNHVLRFAKLGDENWQPEYTTSENGGTSMVESIYLKNPTRGNKLAAGVLMNRSWNWYTVSQGGICDVAADEGSIPVFMKELKPATYQEEPIRLPRMERLRSYTIEYYDPVTGDVLHSESQRTLSGRLLLNKYPELSVNRPIIFFIVKRNGGDNP
ncbi:MAG: hypothetical protein JNM00_05140 [Flavobacteriales bacterium]|nr:hypothetical protein [Flavobacteriales bacterium]